jgi:hypothetical protein
MAVWENTDILNAVRKSSLSSFVRINANKKLKDVSKK